VPRIPAEAPVLVQAEAVAVAEEPLPQVAVVAEVAEAAAALQPVPAADYQPGAAPEPEAAV
jgi:hypothetical protein